jgi:hypothetical protein
MLNGQLNPPTDSYLNKKAGLICVTSDVFIRLYDDVSDAV